MTTDLNMVKDVAITFLYLEPQYKDDKFKMFIAHPFFDSSFLMDYETKSMYHIFEDTDTFEKNRVFLKHMIKKETSVKNLFYMICQPYRLTFFKYINQYLSEQDFSELLMIGWTMTEFVNNHPNVTLNEFVSWFQKADKNYLMDEDELKVLHDLPEIVTIYRGVGSNKYKNGMSWTLDLDKARWFSKRFNFDGEYVYQGTINKSDILVYTEQRNESEVIVNPRKVKNIGEI